ncbi:signaling protein [Streptomyces sp. 2P-4]|uniref:phage baseplate protein n=1 Tax=Streptomyces sp. 2P-4 TaxID=2931974 RepID=UPI00254018C6|nr:signaling protein [Streptomyces sp. 2P-4]
MADDKRIFSRRSVLFGGGATAAAVTAGGAAWALRPGQESGSAFGFGFGSGWRGASQPVVGAFDMRTGAEVLAPSALFNSTGPQSFAFDDTNGQVFTLQTVQGGLLLGGEAGPVAYGDRKSAGDMCLTRMTGSGITLGHMYLRGFGHGISFGVEPTGPRTYIWLEGRADPKSGYGRTVVRVPFRDGAVLNSSDESVRHFDPVPGAADVCPALDLAGGRVLVSHQQGGLHRFSVYGMEDFLAGRFTPAQTIKAGVQVKEEEWFQGCALHGDYVYVLTGKPYTGKNGSNPRKSGGNTYVSAIDVRTGRPQGRHHVTVAPDLPYREPEGLAVRQAASQPALCLGFSVKAHDRRELTVYGFTV